MTVRVILVCSQDVLCMYPPKESAGRMHICSQQLTFVSYASILSPSSCLIRLRRGKSQYCICGAFQRLLGGRLPNYFYFICLASVGNRLLHLRFWLHRVAYISIVSFFNREVCWLLKISSFFIVWSLVYIMCSHKICVTFAICLDQCPKLDFYCLTCFAYVRAFRLVSRSAFFNSHCQRLWHF